MNIGFYVESCGGSPLNTEIYNFLNQAIADTEVEDAAVFFNSINFNPTTCKFGMFDSTELWHFNGNLICTSIDNLYRTGGIVNNIEAAYLFTADQKNERTLFELVNIARQYKVVTRTDADKKEFTRITGMTPISLEGFTVQNFRELFNG
jgi:hypothetical protein